ncbi:MAG TPA: hypothetical protein VMB47_12790 [Candidatus Aquilonibacter sp.]|nr:hypothetical protein [Candidatus Aquilonibacter sp.]
MTKPQRILVFFALPLALVASGIAHADSTTGPIITFRKVFKSSYPEFVEIKVSQSGAGTCDIRQLDEQPSPQPFHIDPPLVQQIFDLAAKLHDFQGVDLEVHKHLASLGEKTFEYKNGAEDYQVTFNYTLDPNGAALMNLFENLSQQETDLSDLTRTMQYDVLGVNDVVATIESHYNDHLLPEPAQFIAPLEKLASDPQYMDIARNRARNLADRIRADNPQATK